MKCWPLDFTMILLSLSLEWILKLIKWHSVTAWSWIHIYCNRTVNMGAMGLKEPLNFQRRVFKLIHIWGNSIAIYLLSQRSLEPLTVPLYCTVKRTYGIWPIDFKAASAKQNLLGITFVFFVPSGPHLFFFISNAVNKQSLDKTGVL